MPASSKRAATPSSWKPGQSGNPKGREPDAKVRELKEAALSKCPKALRVVEDALDDPNPDVRLKAASILFDRGIGRPSQAIDLKADVSVTDKRADELTDDELAAIATRGKKSA